MQLIGLDVGFSAKRRSSGLAVLCDGAVQVGRASSEAASRLALLGEVTAAAVTAIDAPLLATLDARIRPCERLFARGRFQRRCKAGFSHVKGTGFGLRCAGSEAASQLARVTSEARLETPFPRMRGDQNMVEAFPNAFLGVCVGAEKYSAMPKLKRGRKFDWLYDTWCELGSFEAIVEMLGESIPKALGPRCLETRNHDERAALVCLLTAAAVALGTYTAIGEPEGGYLFLPPWTFWSEWARGEVATQRLADPSIEVWIDGRIFRAGETM